LRSPHPEDASSDKAIEELSDERLFPGQIEIELARNTSKPSVISSSNTSGVTTSNSSSSMSLRNLLSAAVSNLSFSTSSSSSTRPPSSEAPKKGAYSEILIEARDKLLNKIKDLRIAEVEGSWFLLYILRDGTIVFGGAPLGDSTEKPSLPNPSLDSFYRHVHNGLGMLLSVSHLPTVLESDPSRAVFGANNTSYSSVAEFSALTSTGYYLYPRDNLVALRDTLFHAPDRASRQLARAGGKAVVFGRVDQRCLACLAFDCEGGRLGYLEDVELTWSGTKGTEFLSGLDFVGSTLLNICV